MARQRAPRRHRTARPASRQPAARAASRPTAGTTARATASAPPARTPRSASPARTPRSASPARTPRSASPARSPRSASPARKPRSASPSRSATAGAIQERKLGHIEACLDDGVDQQRDSFGPYKLRYCALPELALADVSTETTFAGRTIAAPLIISSMTGGAGEPFRTINRNLALAAERLRIPLGLGSMKVMLGDAAAEASFQVRELAPSVPLISNLGLVSFNHGLALEHLDRVLAATRADVCGLHLNALQEVVQEGGDTDFRGLLEHLEAICAHTPLPVYVKECGGGIAPELVERLEAAGVAYVDISGSDGTSWAAVEARLSAEPAFGERFRDFGLPTAWILERLAPRPARRVGIVASGGIRNGVQAAKALALGADCVAVARPFLQAALESADAVVAIGERIIRELRTALFLTGCGSLRDLQRSHLLTPAEQGTPPAP